LIQAVIEVLLAAQRESKKETAKKTKWKKDSPFYSHDNACHILA